jgi:hypothetical protein
MNQPIALAVIAAGLLLAGWLDGQDAQLMEKRPIALACTHCAGGVR